MMDSQDNVLKQDITEEAVAAQPANVDNDTVAEAGNAPATTAVDSEPDTEAAPMKMYASKHEVLERVKELAHSDETPAKDEVDHLKTAFYKLLFAEREDAILPSFWGSNAIMLVAGTVLYGVFLLFSGATQLQGLLCLWLFNIMIVNWNGLSYLTAIKDYRGILCSFAAAIGVACLCALAALALGLPPVEGLLASIALGYGVMRAWEVVLLSR